jgi:predicted nucleic acid-binding protein
VSPLPFLDTNIVLRHVPGDNPNHSPRATAYIGRIEAGEISVRTVDTVVFESVFTLEKHYRLPRAVIRDAPQEILGLPGIVLPGKRWYRYAFDLWVNHPAFSFADCYHAAVMRRLKLTELISFDRALDRLPHATRIEPA